MANQHEPSSIPEFNEWMSEALQNHLAEELSAVHEVGEIQHAIHELV